MKKIFSEQAEPVAAIIAIYDEEEGKVYHNRELFYPSTEAYYDKKLRVLCVDQTVSCHDWASDNARFDVPQDRRILETHTTKEQALRRTIQLANEWTAQLLDAVCDDDRTDEEIMEWALTP